MKLKNKLLIGIGAIALVAVVAVVAVVATLAATQQTANTSFSVTYTPHEVSARIRAKYYMPEATGTEYDPYTAIADTMYGHSMLTTNSQAAAVSLFTSGQSSVLDNYDEMFILDTAGAKDYVYIEYHAGEAQSDSASLYAQTAVPAETNNFTSQPYVILVHEITNLSNSKEFEVQMRYTMDDNGIPNPNPGYIQQMGNVDIYYAAVATVETDNCPGYATLADFNTAVYGSNNNISEDAILQRLLKVMTGTASHQDSNHDYDGYVALQQNETGDAIYNFFTDSAFALEADQYQGTAHAFVEPSTTVYVFTMIKIHNLDNSTVFEGNLVLDMFSDATQYIGTYTPANA